MSQLWIFLVPSHGCQDTALTYSYQSGITMITLLLPSCQAIHILPCQQSSCLSSMNWQFMYCMEVNLMVCASDAQSSWYLHTRFNFHQSLGHVGIGYKTRHENEYDEQSSHNKPVSHEYKPGQNLIHRNNTMLKTVKWSDVQKWQ